MAPWTRGETAGRMWTTKVAASGLLRNEARPSAVGSARNSHKVASHVQKNRLILGELAAIPSSSPPVLHHSLVAETGGVIAAWRGLGLIKTQ